MSIYQQYCKEVLDENGRLQKITLTYPDNFNFGYDVVDKIAEETPDKRALVWCNAKGEEHIYSFADIQKYSNQMANVFLRAGIGRGDRVMLVLKRHYEYWFAAIALHKIGAVMIPATHMLTVRDLVYRIQSAQVKAILCTAQDGVPEKIRTALREGNKEVKLWYVQQEDAEKALAESRQWKAENSKNEQQQEDAEKALVESRQWKAENSKNEQRQEDVEKTLAESRQWEVENLKNEQRQEDLKTEGFENMSVSMKTASETLERIQTSASDPMLLYFTSGTTGNPKGVIHAYSYPLAHIVTAKYWHQAEDGGLHFTVAETGWAKASWGKLYGQWLVGSAVMVYDFDNFEPKQLVEVINRYGVTSFCAPPTVYRYLVRKGIPKMPTLKHASTAGEMLAPEVFRKFTQATGLPLCEGYGQTETALLMANFQGEDAVEGSMGTPSPLYQIELRGKENQSVGAGEIGEVVIVPDENGKCPGIFTGYLDQEDAYRNAWRDGVYHTGDAAYFDENGRYWFYGRFDDIIKTGGFRVGPYEVEHVLMEHPAVSECSVIGVPDSLRGQAIKAVVVLENGYLPSRALELEIKNFCNQKLAEYKWIRLLTFAKELPKTISGKTRKRMLK